MTDGSRTKHRATFWLTSAAVPFVVFVRAMFNTDGDTPLFIVAFILCFYVGVFALLFFPTYIEATRNSDAVDRAMSFTIGAMLFSHLIAIGGAWTTDSNAFLFAYPAIATASLMILKYTPLAQSHNEVQG